jgi:hypothetical protein
VARSAFQVANLVAPQFLIEIEAIAAKKPAPAAKTRSKRIAPVRARWPDRRLSPRHSSPFRWRGGSF